MRKENSIFAGLFQAMDITVLQRMDKDHFQLLGTPPDWFTHIFRKDNMTEKLFNPGSQSPFLENFLIDAENFWISEITGFLKSGLWIETDPSENDHSFEAIAVSMNEIKIVLIELASHAYIEKQSIIQKGRDLHLAYNSLERLKEEISKAKNRAEAANYAKSVFFAKMTHELRTPLSAIIGFSELLQEQFYGELSDKQTRFINNIYESGYHLLELINDILDTSKIEAGKMDIHLSSVGIKKLLEHSVNLIEEKALRKKLNIELRMSDEFESMEVMADEKRLKQILNNLLSNAVKYTPDKGAVFIKVRKENEEMVVSVSDTGIGIKPDDQERIFQDYEKVHSLYTSNQEGTGLGLSLTRKLIELHGGRIWVESEGEGKGSTFSFSIPLKQKM